MPLQTWEVKSGTASNDQAAQIYSIYVEDNLEKQNILTTSFILWACEDRH